jgi:hypothetical protein
VADDFEAWEDEVFCEDKDRHCPHAIIIDYHIGCDDITACKRKIRNGNYLSRLPKKKDGKKEESE